MFGGFLFGAFQMNNIRHPELVSVYQPVLRSFEDILSRRPPQENKFRVTMKEEMADAD